MRLSSLNFCSGQACQSRFAQAQLRLDNADIAVRTPHSWERAMNLSLGILRLRHRWEGELQGGSVFLGVHSSVMAGSHQAGGLNTKKSMRYTGLDRVKI